MFLVHCVQKTYIHTRLVMYCRISKNETSLCAMIQSISCDSTTGFHWILFSLVCLVGLFQFVGHVYHILLATSSAKLYSEAYNHDWGHSWQFSYIYETNVCLCTLRARDWLMVHNATQKYALHRKYGQTIRTQWQYSGKDLKPDQKRTRNRRKNSNNNNHLKNVRHTPMVMRMLYVYACMWIGCTSSKARKPIKQKKRKEFNSDRITEA